MSDTIIARGSESKFKPHPIGQYVAQCVDTIDLGEKVADYPGSDPYLTRVCALVFRTGERNDETGEYIDVAKEYTVSMGDRANLRKDLEQWRGRPYTKEQLEEGVPLDKLTGNHALITVTHRTSGKGRTYANITAIVGVPRQMAGACAKYDDYTRAEYWEKKKQEYAEGAARFRSEQSATRPGTVDDDGFPSALQDDEDDLPF